MGIAVFVALALVAFVWFFNNGGLNLGTATEGTASVADTTQTAPAATPTDDATQQEAAAATPANTDDAAPAPAQADTAPTDEQYTGELAFLGTLVPQMHIDIDKLYAYGGLTSGKLGIDVAIASKTADGSHDKVFFGDPTIFAASPVAMPISFG